jgi:hypothetical protein
MKTHGVEVQLHRFFTSVADGGEWLVLPRGESATSGQEIGWVPDMEAVRTEYVASVGNSTFLGRSARSPSLYRLSHPG